MNITQFVELCKVFGISMPSNPAGAMTAEQIITALDASIGNFWKQGISGGILVNDLGEDSPDLAPYINGDGKWELPPNTIVVLNTNRLSAESALGRSFLCTGDTYFFATGVDTKGMTLANGVGLGDYAVECATGSAIISFVGVYAVSTDATRPFFNITDAAYLIFNCGAFAATVPGLVNASSVQMMPSVYLFAQSPLEIGEKCDILIGKNFNMLQGFLSAQEGFDCSTPPTSGSRIVDFQGITGNPQANDSYLVDIGDDDGSNTVAIRGASASIPLSYLVKYTGIGNQYECLGSINCDIDVAGVGKSYRMGEAYFSDDQEIVFANADEWTDLFSAAIGEGSLSAGIRMTANPGELEYMLDKPGIVKVTAYIEGQPATGSPAINFGAFWEEDGESYAQISKGGYPVETDMDHGGNEMYSAMLQFTIRLSQGEKVKCMLMNETNTNSFQLHNYSIIAEVIT